MSSTVSSGIRFYPRGFRHGPVYPSTIHDPTTDNNWRTLVSRVGGGLSRVRTVPVLPLPDPVLTSSPPYGRRTPGRGSSQWYDDTRVWVGKHHPVYLRTGSSPLHGSSFPNRPVKTLQSHLPFTTPN